MEQEGKRRPPHFQCAVRRLSRQDRMWHWAVRSLARPAGCLAGVPGPYRTKCQAQPGLNRETPGGWPGAPDGSPDGPVYTGPNTGLYRTTTEPTRCQPGVNPGVHRPARRGIRSHRTMHQSVRWGVRYTGFLDKKLRWQVTTAGFQAGV